MKFLQFGACNYGINDDTIFKSASFIEIIGLSKERPILGDHPKAHKTLYEKRCTLHEKWHFS